MPVRFDDEFLNDPVAAYARLREAPVHDAESPDGRPIRLVTRHADVKAALADPVLSLDKANANDGYRGLALPPELDANLLNMDAPEHTRLRRILSRAFTPPRVAALRPAVEAIAEDLADGVTGADLLAEYTIPLPIRVICALLGVAPEDVKQFREWTDAVIIPENAESARAAMGALYAYLTELIAAKQKTPGDDLLSVVNGALTRDEQLSAAFLLLLGGYENVVHVLGNGLVELLTRPEARDAVAADPGLLASTVDEIIRYASPTQLAIRRFPVSDMEIGGCPVAKGETVMLALTSAHRDPAVFADPDGFDIRRTPNPHLGYGFGPHYCLGAPLARLELEVGFATLLRRFPRMRLAVSPGELRWRSSFRTRGLRALPVHLT